MSLDFYEMLNVLIHLVIVVVATIHMNQMHRKTPLLEVAAWWCIGVASFAEAALDGSAPRIVDTVFTAGVAALAIIHTKPQWRAVLADRRQKPRAEA